MKRSRKSLCKKSRKRNKKSPKRSKKTYRRRSRKDYGNIFGRRNEIPENFEDVSSKVLFKKPSKRLKLSNAQYKRIQDWAKKELEKKRK